MWDRVIIPENDGTFSVLYLTCLSLNLKKVSSSSGVAHTYMDGWMDRKREREREILLFILLINFCGKWNHTRASKSWENAKKENAKTPMY